MEDLHILRTVRSNPGEDGLRYRYAADSQKPALSSFLAEQRQMSASTPPVLNDETRIPLPMECHIPLPPSPTVSEPVLNTSTMEDPGEQLPIPLLELLHAIQEDKYESRRLIVLQDEAYGLFHKCGSYDRFLTVQEQLYRRMIDCFRNDKKTAFASLFTKAMSYPSFGELRMGELLQDDDADRSSETSWLQRMPPGSRQALLDFIFRLRSDPGFIAERISSLATSQLRNLVRPHRSPEPGPIFRPPQSQGRYDGRNAGRALNRNPEADVSVDDQLGDPLLLMVHGLFDSTPSEKYMQIDAWSSVCAKLIEEGKSGADEFCLTVTNLFLDHSDWPVVPKLELFLSDLIAAGSSFLEAGGQNTKSNHPQQRDSGAGVSSSFLDYYTPTLLDLLCTNAAPQQALDLIRLTLAKIRDPERRITARNFFFLRWYCASFLMTAITYPEYYGILVDHHINNSVRQKIFRELATRIQSTVSDVLSPWSSKPVSPVLEMRVRRIISVFEEPGPLLLLTSDAGDDNRSFLFLRMEDVLSVAKALVVDSEPESSATSIFEQVSPSSPSMLAYQGQFMAILATPQLVPNVHGALQQSQTWHGSRPFVDSGYNTIDKSYHRQSDASGSLVDVEKDPSLSFIQDLRMLAASRDFQPSGPSKNEVVTIFIESPGAKLVLDPFQTDTTINSVMISSSRLSEREQSLLLAAVSQLADRKSDVLLKFSNGHMISAAELLDLFRNKAEEAKAGYDFQSEYFWWQCLEIARTISFGAISSFMRSLARQRQDSVNNKRRLAKEHDDWLHALRSRSSAQDRQTQALSTACRTLRNKMWFVSDVRHSSAYEDAYNIVRALRAMVEPPEVKQPGVTGWAKQRFKSSYGQERILTQTLELMTAPRTYGGPNKLSESQVEITSGWLLHDNIENFCRGEERIHRFCYEIQKCVKRLAGEAMLDSPVLWSSPLFSGEKAEHGIAGHAGSRHSQERPTWRTDFSYPQWGTGQAITGQPTFPTIETAVPPGSPGATRTSFSPMLPPVQQFASPQMQQNWMLPPSPVSPGVMKPLNDSGTLRRRSFLQNLRSQLTSLLLSDLGSYLWSNGSETDRWISSHNFPRRPSSSGVPNIFMDPFQSPNQEQKARTPFDLSGACRILLQRFRLTSNPQNKLQHLYELFLLVSQIRQARENESDNMGFKSGRRLTGLPLPDLGIGAGVPRTRLTRLQEVAANCEDRRVASISKSRLGNGFGSYSLMIPMPDLDDSDAVAAVQEIFEDPSYRPSTFFRDMQYIAAFTPSSILDSTPQGTAFWTIGLAAMRIKAEKSKIMTDNAMQILEYHYGNGSKKEPVRVGQNSPGRDSTSSSTLRLEVLMGTTLQNAAQLLTRSALEGDPTAARELALFHLTHPELVSRVTLPLSRPSDVFRAKHGNTTERGQRNNAEESGGLDSVTFAVVFHWMEFAANAGDADAIAFFKENQDLGRAL